MTVPLTQVSAASGRLRLLTLDITGETFDYLAGQAVRVAPHGSIDRRPYSIACSPERAAETRTLELLIAMEGGSEDLGWAAAGARVDVEGPVGSFTFPPSFEQQRLLFVAGGTGIAPVRAMIDHALRLPPAHRISLLYSTRRSDEFAFIDEFRTHERGGRLEVHQTVTRDDSATWGGSRGRMGRSHFEAVLRAPAATLCFVCGPPLMVSESEATLQVLGVPAGSIKTEMWGK